MKRFLRALVVLATSTLVVCGVKGPPRPPESGAADLADAGPTDGGAK
jgi:predicted small lipoprotein YifL